ncbi:hypothetical protein AGMMS50276_24240 [Synergistales bacterium]|nr:hypothetical protein AGMMS50276_24240 [Synergistales bacterium]
MKKRILIVFLLAGIFVCAEIGRMAIDYARDYAGGNEKLTGTAAFKQLQEASEVTIKR